MKKLFYIGIIVLILFEFLNVYFIMPMPGSQRMQSIEIAYFLYKWRWFFRGFLTVQILLGFFEAITSHKWQTIALILIALIAIYMFNFQMAADAMFEQPQKLQMADAKANKIPKQRLVISITQNGEAKAYPISLIAYHHQVIDTLDGKPIMVTYCTVCRTGRVFEPIVNNKYETFRLVGMDHFNAMFEDATTHSWWRQANGEAIIGKLKGKTLPELSCSQTSLEKWLALYPNSLIMQPDVASKEHYDSLAKYDVGKGKSDLTKTNPKSWQEKSWIVGIALEKHSKAFDWNRLKKEKIIQNNIGNQAIILLLAKDGKSFFAFKNPLPESTFSLKNDTLTCNNIRYDLKGNQIGNSEHSNDLIKINAYQEFWHSWQTFHPNTEKY